MPILSYFIIMYSLTTNCPIIYRQTYKNIKMHLHNLKIPSYSRSETDNLFEQ